MSEDDVTALYCCCQAISWSIHNAALDATTADNIAGFALNRASYGSALNTYPAASQLSIRKGDSSCYFLRAQGVLHPMSSRKIFEHINTIHVMLGLAKDRALIWQGHPLLGEYHSPSSSHPLRFFQVPRLRKAKGLRLLCDLLLTLSPFSSY